MRGRNDDLLAERPEWRPLVEQVAAAGNSCIGVPPPAGVPASSWIGKGHYCLLQGSMRNDGSARWHLYWCFGQSNKGKIKLGSYVAESSRAAHRGPKRGQGGRPSKAIGKEVMSDLTVGFDAMGRRIMRINGGKGNEWLVAIQLDAQGLPVPVPV